MFQKFIVYMMLIEQEVMLEFRAGKMLLEGKRVTPDTRKGLVRISRVCLIIKIVYFVFIL